MLTLHIVVALLGIVASSWLYFQPNKKLYRASSGLLVLTLISGTSLIFINSVSILRTCLTGLAYTAFVVSMLYISSKKIPAHAIAEDK